jgi:hypothetical protein
MELLTSGRSDEEVSGEVAEIVGFDELEFVTSLVQHRHAIVNQVSFSISSEYILTSRREG